MKEKLRRPGIILLVGICLVIACAYGVIYTTAGELNPDEGYYLLGAELLSRGQRPYVDFSFTQAPMSLTIYSFLLSFYHFGIVEGRIVSLGMVMTILLLVVFISYYLWDMGGVLICLMLFASSPNMVYQLIPIRAYPQGALFILCSVFFLIVEARGFENKSIGYLRAVACVLFAVMAGCTRLSLWGYALTVLAVLLWQSKKDLLGIFIITSSFILFSFSFLGSIFMLYPKQAYFNLVAYHLAREIGGIFQIALGKLTFLAASFCYTYWLWGLIAIGLIAQSSLNQREYDPFAPKDMKKEKSSISAMSMLWMTALSVIISHLPAQVGYRDHHYLAPIYPIILLLATGYSIKLLEHLRSRHLTRLYWIVFAVGCVLAMISFGRNKISPDHIRDVKEIAKIIKQNTSITDKILTPDTYIAVEADRDVIPGSEGCFLYPSMSYEQAQLYRVMNLDMLKSTLKQRQAKILVLKESSFRIRYPDFKPIAKEHFEEIWNIIDNNYELIHSIENFGPFGDKELIYGTKDNM